MFIAGEASGDLHASHLISSIRELDPAAEIRFFGGDLMAKAARCKPDLHYDQMNVMGFSEVLRRLPRIFGNLKKAMKAGDMMSEEEILKLQQNTQQPNMDGVSKPSRRWLKLRRQKK